VTWRQTNYNRDEAQACATIDAKAQFEVHRGEFDSLCRPSSPSSEAVIAKKTLRAPFAGHLGIRAVNAGQYYQPGTP